MTKFFKAIEKKDFQKITQLLENEEIDIDENLWSDSVRSSSGSHKRITQSLHCLEYSLGKPDLFIFLLRKGANPLCAISAILRELPYLENVIASTTGGAGLESPLFPFVAKRLSSLRGRERKTFHHLLLKYDFPVPCDGEWRNQNKEECEVNGNTIGISRCDRL